MIGFVPEKPRVAVQAEGEHTWTVQETYHYNDFTVPTGQTTDLVSSPRPTSWLVPPYGRYTPAGVLHDTLWRRYCAAGLLGYREADAIFLESMRLLGVPFIQRWLMWTGVRWGALTRRGGYVGWWRDAPLVLVWTLVALPIVTVPAVAITTIGLPILALFELLAWVLLAAGRALRRQPREQRKYLNPPKVTART
jgi:hypothetical protein